MSRDITSTILGISVVGVSTELIEPLLGIRPNMYIVENLQTMFMRMIHVDHYAERFTYFAQIRAVLDAIEELNHNDSERKKLNSPTYRSRFHSNHEVNEAIKRLRGLAAGAVGITREYITHKGELTTMCGDDYFKLASVDLSLLVGECE